MNLGWIKLHRKILDSRVFANEGLLKLWIYCLCRANHEQNYVDIRTGKGKTETKVGPGEFIFGRNSASKDLNMNPSTVYKRMQKLQDIGNINIKSNSHYSIVSVCNWETYQNSEDEKEQPKEQASNNQVTGREQASNTDKNDNNVKNDKNVKNKPYSEDFEDFWELYDVKKGKKKAWLEWKNLSVEAKEEIMENVPIFLTHFSTKQYTPRPRKYLYNRYWEDEDYQKPQKDEDEKKERKYTPITNGSDLSGLKQTQQKYPTGDELKRG